jgi:hypothetical protein
MSRIWTHALLIPCLAVGGVGCSGRFQRPKPYDPFASARQTKASGEVAGSEPSRETAPDVKQAGREFSPRPVIPDRPQRAASNVSSHLDDESDSGAESRPRSSVRPGSPSTLEHAPDYSWIQGRLEYSALSGGIWRVRYAPLSADDEHGGCVILESLPAGIPFRNGDMVYVEGRIVDRARRGPLPNPIYRVDAMNRPNE